MFVVVQEVAGFRYSECHDNVVNVFESSLVGGFPW